MPNGGEIIVEYLAREKVPYVFGLCGHGNVGLLDALYDRTDAIRTISTRHEQTAGHMADAYFRVAHRPVATLTSCGPGSANMPIALACAFMDSSAFPRHHRQCPDFPVQSGGVPGDVPALPGGLPVGRPTVREAELAAHADRHAADRAPAGVRHHAGRAARAREPRRALQRVQGAGGGRHPGARRLAGGHQLPERRRARGDPAGGRALAQARGAP